MITAGPARLIVTLLPRNSPTPMAPPIVGAALLIQKNPTFTPDQVKALLMKTAYKNFPRYTTVTDAGVTYTLQYDVFTVGTGYLDLQAAISASDVPPLSLSAMSPTATYDASCDCVYFMQNDSNVGREKNFLWG